jgi:catechol 2,3-dioxygenase-like lactoylglutathione lyase family enzyme
VELLHFDDARLPAHWREAARHTDANLLGIDHSALTVSDAARAIAFYRDTLGLALSAQQRNHGPSQARLDGLDDNEVEVDVVGLAPVTAPPHLELLGYRHDTAKAVSPVPCSDVTLMEVEDLALLGQRLGVTPAEQPLHLVDPDGHRLLLVQPNAPR